MDDRSAPFYGGRLQQARELRRLTQAQLAADVSSPAATGRVLSRGAIAQYENGLAAPGPAVLTQLAERLRVEPGFFAVPIHGQEKAASFRSLRSASAAERRQARQLAQLINDAVAVLTSTVRLPEWVQPVEAGRLPPEQSAEAVREAWGLQPGPVENMVLTLERQGAVCARVPEIDAAVDAFSVPFSPLPVVMLGAAKGKHDRSRFDAAHELAHLVLHRDTTKPIKLQEEEAHQFAAAILMPAEQIRPELPSTLDWDQLKALKRRWRVSLAALLRRCRSLDRITAEQYTAGMKQMSARRWRQHEPVDLGPCEQPVLLNRAMTTAGISVQGIAEALRIPASDLEQLIGPSEDRRPLVRL